MSDEDQYVTNYYFTEDSYERLRNDGFHFTPDTPFRLESDPQRLQTLGSLGRDPVYEEIPREEFIARYMKATTERRW